MSTNCESGGIERLARQHSVAPYRSLFQSLDQSYSNVFADRVSPDDPQIAKITEEVGKSVKVWQQSAPLLQLTSPLKLHVLGFTCQRLLRVSGPHLPRSAGVSRG